MKKPKLICEEGRILGEANISSTFVTSKEENDRTETGIILFKYQNVPHVFKSNEICSFNDTKSGILPPWIPSSHEEIRTSKGSLVEHEEESLSALELASFKLIIEYESRLRKIYGKPIKVPRYETECLGKVDQKLSTNAIIRFAGERFIEFLESSSTDLLMTSPIFLKEFSILNREDARDAELVFYLLASADKVGRKQFDQARKLLGHCEVLSSCVGGPVQRLVFYFLKALNEKIDRENMKTTPSNLGRKQFLDVEGEIMRANSTFLAYIKVNPTDLFIQLAAIQAIVEHVTEARKIHIIDFSIKGGQQHSMLIQALAMERGCHLEHLKITAIGTTSKSKIEEAGNKLTSFAQSMSVPFSFNVVMVDDILNLNEGLLSVNSDETVVVYSAYFLRSMLMLRLKAFSSV
ncbi:hypothetical protein LIER_42028 [Lithospermum erythrorhizon]|uniref:Uncharacterized protein n=1 Tax=Lithospermum erythrorhizon TaxID=34254 RepID=A0AAV3RNE1_LITER